MNEKQGHEDVVVTGAVGVMGHMLLKIRAAGLRQLLLAVPARLRDPAARQSQSRAAHPPAATIKAVTRRDRNHSDA